MSFNPHLEAELKLEALRSRDPLLSRLVRRLGPLALGLLAAPLAQPVLLWFVGADGETYASGLSGISFRLALLLCAVGVMAAHNTVMRGPDRAVLDPHPVDPTRLLPVLRRRLLRRSLWLAIGATALLSPLLFNSPPGIQPVIPFVLSALLLMAGWLAGITLGFVTQLGAVKAADNKLLNSVLEAIRGSNPRTQAALIYAPGLAIAAAGASLFTGAWGIQLCLAGRWAGLLGYLPTLALSWLAWGLAAPLADSCWYRASSLLTEIDAQYAGLDDSENASRVYLDWSVRWAPAPFRPHLLRALRQGWRALRSWVTGAWAAGVLAAFPAWSVDPAAPQRALLICVTATCLLAIIAIRMEETDPAWLDRALALPMANRLSARFLAVLAYLQGAILPATAALLTRQGAAAWSLLLPAEAAAVICALTATAASPLRGRAYTLYLPLAILTWAALAGGLP